MMQTLLQAGYVCADEFDGVFIVGFADRQFDTSRYLMLKRSLTSGHDDGIYFEHNNQAFSGYGTVSRCVLSGGRIEMTIDEKTARNLGTEMTFAIEFSCDQELLQRLRKGLERVFAGTQCPVTTL